MYDTQQAVMFQHVTELCHSPYQEFVDHQQDLKAFILRCKIYLVLLEGEEWC